MRSPASNPNRTKPGKHQSKSLIAVAAGSGAERLVNKICERFDRDLFDIWLMVYDDASFSGAAFARCRTMRDKGLQKWAFARRYLHPRALAGYDYLFFWDDDIDIGDHFCASTYLNIIRSHGIELSQPAILHPGGSIRSILYRHDTPIGRYTDFVEIMVPVFAVQAWKKAWRFVQDDYNFWGWGYDRLWPYACGITKIAVIDSQPVRHTRPSRSKHNPKVSADYHRFLWQHLRYPFSRTQVVFGEIGVLPDWKLRCLKLLKTSLVLCEHWNPVNVYTLWSNQRKYADAPRCEGLSGLE